jgi:4-oxalocrotonate tautomerase
MPMVRIAMFPGRTDEQKEKLAQRITQAFVEEANATAESIHVIYEEVQKNDWAVAGQLAINRDKKRS